MLDPGPVAQDLTCRLAGFVEEVGHEEAVVAKEDDVDFGPVDGFDLVGEGDGLEGVVLVVFEGLVRKIAGVSVRSMGGLSSMYEPKSSRVENDLRILS